MPIEDRNLAIGTRLVATYKGERFHAVVTAREKDRLGYTLEDGESKGVEFKSLSEAGGLITGGSVNGWKFWSVEGMEPQPKAKTAREPRSVGPRRIGKAQIELRQPSYDEDKSREARANAASAKCSQGDHPLKGPAPDLEFHQKRGDGGRIIDICCACAHPETLKPPPGTGRKPSPVTVRKISSVGSSDPSGRPNSKGRQQIEDMVAASKAKHADDDGPQGLKELLNIGAPTKRRSVRRAAK